MTVSVRFPGTKPPSAYVEYNSPLRGAYTVHVTSSFIFVSNDLPKGTDPSQFLPKAYEDLLTRYRGERLISKESTVLQGVQAHEYVVVVGKDDRENTVRLWLIVIGDRLFQQYAQWRSASEKDKLVADEFFNSFRVIKR